MDRGSFDGDIASVLSRARGRAKPRFQDDPVSQAAFMASANMGKMPAPGSPAALRRARGDVALQDLPPGELAGRMGAEEMPEDLPMPEEVLGGQDAGPTSTASILDGLSRTEFFRRLLGRR